MVVIELNEFNLCLLKSACDQLNLPNIQRIIEMKHSITEAEDLKEGFGLDPWVQWVSVNTGKRMSEHGITHLAEASRLSCPQVWEVLSRKDGRSHGVWGCMNAKRSVDQCDFFFPDPWTFCQEAFPEKLNDLLSLPRHYAKNYGEISYMKSFVGLLKLVRYCFRESSILLKFLPKFGKTLFRSGLNNLILFAALDYFGALVVQSYRRRCSTTYIFSFLNTLAHYQHHRWQLDNIVDQKDASAFSLLDEALGVLIDLKDKDEPLIILNGFSQENTKAKNETLYRQKSPERFFAEVGVKNCRIEQLMTSDTQLIFDTQSAFDQGFRLLSSLTLNGEVAFLIEDRSHDNFQIFCRFLIWGEINPKSEILVDGKRKIKFYDFFEAVVVRTGSHIRSGDVFYQDFQLPAKMNNYSIFESVLKN